ncbi:MAG: hypothetical protein ACAI43_00525 [Phycisphaerae bacterium]|nr:hypothetical protein [Tepidisphaeraceae bacterium]
MLSSFILHPSSFLLAAADDGTLIKILFGVVAVVIWAISATASAAKQRAEQARRRQQYGQLPPDVVQPTYGGVPYPPSDAGYAGQPQAYAPPGYAPPAYPPAYVPPPVPQQAGPTKKQRKQQQQQRAATQKRAAEAAAVTAQKETRAAVVAQRDAEAATEARAAKPRSAAKGGTPAAQIGRLARRPDSLRAAFILSEVLSAPKSLRNETGRML